METRPDYLTLEEDKTTGLSPARDEWHPFEFSPVSEGPHAAMLHSPQTPRVRMFYNQAFSYRRLWEEALSETENTAHLLSIRTTERDNARAALNIERERVTRLQDELAAARDFARKAGGVLEDNAEMGGETSTDTAADDKARLLRAVEILREEAPHRVKDLWLAQSERGA
jgi:hypothetical protein